MSAPEGEEEKIALGEDLATYRDRRRIVRAFANDDTADRYFSSTGGGTTNQATALNRMFDRYRGLSSRKLLINDCQADTATSR